MIWVRHASGKESKVGFKSYEQGRRSFEGEAKDFIWCDEEPPMEAYVEMPYRLLTTKGLVRAEMHAACDEAASRNTFCGK